MSGPVGSSAATPVPKGAPSGQTPDPNDLRSRERQEGWAVPLDRVEAFTAGAVIAVEPEKIEQELMALWRKAAERARDSGGRLAVARACLWNFIVHSDGEHEYRRTKRALDEVSETVPARILALHETWDESQSAVVGDDGTPLRAYIEANYRKVSGGRREVVAEEITLEATRLQSQRLPGLVRSLLLADVPTALFIKNPAADYKWLPQLARDADRFIFDSGKVDGMQGLLQVDAVLQRLRPAGKPGTAPLPMELADLGWLRLWPWRILIASMFDEPEATATLSTLDEVHIEYAPDAEAAALLLAGWLMGRLQLGASSDELELAAHEGRPASLDFALRAEDKAGQGRKVALRLIRGTTELAPVGIHRVTLRSGDSSFTAHGTCSGGTPCIELRSPLAPPRVQPVQGRRDSELLVAAMGIGGRDPLMYEALRHGARLARGAGRHLRPQG
jgi:glucose-6-phosphate dehydrogenase assembly protein OpcA